MAGVGGWGQDALQPQQNHKYAPFLILGKVGHTKAIKFFGQGWWSLGGGGFTMSTEPEGGKQCPSLQHVGVAYTFQTTLQLPNHPSHASLAKTDLALNSSSHNSGTVGRGGG